MCLTQTATILARLGGDVLVEINGRNRLVSNTLLLDVRVGDHVIIGHGCILGRASAMDSNELRSLHAAMANPIRNGAPNRRRPRAGVAAGVRHR
ncbi:MAG TPA: HypC/HybG/HupF family hydrogenase formation chaperone [Candidatus Limnocylindrales bacterium]|jgi:hypothetical protein